MCRMEKMEKMEDRRQLMTSLIYLLEVTHSLFDQSLSH
jgi:hypothetical protein